MCFLTNCPSEAAHASTVNDINGSLSEELNRSTLMLRFSLGLQTPSSLILNFPDVHGAWWDWTSFNSVCVSICRITQKLNSRFPPNPVQLCNMSRWRTGFIGGRIYTTSREKTHFLHGVWRTSALRSAILVWKLWPWRFCALFIHMIKTSQVISEFCVNQEIQTTSHSATVAIVWMITDLKNVNINCMTKSCSWTGHTSCTHNKTATCWSQRQCIDLLLKIRSGSERLEPQGEDKDQ